MIERVGIGQYRVIRSRGLLVAYGLGSCVGLFLYDPQTEIGGLAHIMLPGARPSDNLTVSENKFAVNACESMLEEMRQSGADPRGISAVMVGGAHMFHDTAELSKQIGFRNQESVRQILQDRSIALMAEETGGDLGRTMEADVSSGNVT